MPTATPFLFIYFVTDTNEGILNASVAEKPTLASIVLKAKIMYLVDLSNTIDFDSRT